MTTAVAAAAPVRFSFAEKAPEIISSLVLANGLLNLGTSIEQIVERATVNGARALHRPELGTLNEGAAADVAVFEIERGDFAFVDSEQHKLAGSRRLRCVLTVRQGAIVWDSDGLSAPDWKRAGPYTNFK